jgi:8-oxo-dGTP pyrophosphatase MutT (NUDIX family)
MVDILNPPQIKIHYINDVDGPPFLRLRHVKMKLEYPHGEFSEEFVHDIVERGKLDAVVIVPYEMRYDHAATRAADRGCAPRPLKFTPWVWLRSCVRPAVGARFEFPNSQGCGWELPAGLIDPGELPEETAIRELREEVGFEVCEVRELGRPVWGSVGLASERLYFFAVDVSGLERHIPSEDGSPLERHGECILAPYDKALQVGDMKTDLGVMRLKEKLSRAC